MTSKNFVDSTLFQQMKALFPIFCVDTMIYSGERGWLLGKRKNPPAKGEWFSIGGRLFKGESLAACAIRKVWEEAGLRIRDLQFVGILEDRFESEDLHFIGALYQAAAIGEPAALPLTSDFSELKWFPQPLPYFHAFLLKRFNMVKR